MKFKHTEHWLMWDWMMGQLALRKDCELGYLKTMWLKKYVPDEDWPESACYACEYDRIECESALSMGEDVINCHFCPLVGMRRCGPGSWFDSLATARTGAEWSMLCKTIRDRKVKAGVECE